MNDDLAALIHRHTVVGGYPNTHAIAEEAFEMGRQVPNDAAKHSSAKVNAWVSRALNSPDRDIEMRARKALHDVAGPQTYYREDDAIAAMISFAALSASPLPGPPAIMCGGCGATDPSKRCMGCLHDFGTPDSAWVRKYHAPSRPTPADAGEVRPYPDLLSDEEAKVLLARAEELWADLQANNLGGFSGINRPFWILFEFKRVIEAFGRRDVGLSWSKDDLDAALLSPTILVGDVGESEEGWQPIETAPRDATPILIAMPKAEKPVCEVWWAQDYEGAPGYWMTPMGPSGRGYTILADYPTHWRSLPAAPAAIRALASGEG